MSQDARILEYLRQGYSLTPMSALQLFGCFRLGARIWELKHAGHDIREKDVKQNGKRFASYYLFQGDKQQVFA